MYKHSTIAWHSSSQDSNQNFIPYRYNPSPSTFLMLIGPLFTMILITSKSVSAAAIVVCSAFVSYAGATSTISAATKLTPSRPRMIVRSSRVDHPPVSGVPVAGATINERCQQPGPKTIQCGFDAQAGSNVSISMLRYTGFSVPTLSRIFLIIPAVPISSISRASTI